MPGMTITLMSDPNEQQVRIIRGGGEESCRSVSCTPFPIREEVLNKLMSRNKI